jgi:uncharacterized membrane protein
LIIKKNQILHYISKIGTFMFLYGLIYMVLNFFVGLLPIEKNETIVIPVLITATILIIRSFFKIGSPYKRY